VSGALATRPESGPRAPAAAAPSRGSAVYEGWVHHRRTSPIPHGFRYRIFLPLFDLDELPGLLDDIPLWSARGRAPARFRRSDFLGDPGLPLADCARDLVAERTGSRPEGPVRLLANPRYWGVGFNPVAFYFLHSADPAGGVEAMIAEVTNTPWGERRSYVLEAGGDGLTGTFEKLLHVSPFMPMEQTYEWRASEPGERLAVSIRNHERGEVVFEAGLDLRRTEITPASMRRLLLSYPPMTISTIARIYWNAIKLKVKGAPYFSPPKDGAP
jgi:DUF1365 family protein